MRAILTDISDHNAVDFELCADNMTQIRGSPTSTYKVYLSSEGDYDSMCRYLRDVKWDDLLTTNFTSDSIWSAFCDILNEAIELFAHDLSPSLHITSIVARAHKRTAAIYRAFHSRN